MENPKNASVMEAAACQFRVAEFRGMVLFRERVAEAWRLLREWYRDAGFDESKARPIADMAYAVMSNFSAMSPEKIAILDTSETGWHDDKMAAVVRDQKRELIASLPDLAGFYAEHRRRAEEQDARQQQAAQQRQAEYDAGAPARLLAKLRAGGAELALEGNKIVLAAGTPISEADHVEVRKHRAAVLAILKHEADARRPLVLA